MTEKRELMELWLYELAFSKIDLKDLSMFNRGISIIKGLMIYIKDLHNNNNPEMDEVKQSVIDKASKNRERLLSGVNNGNVNIYT